MNLESIAVVLAAGTTATASAAVADSIAAANDSIQLLNEFVVEAPRVVHKPDMDVLYPSSDAVAKSKDGAQLLNNLRIPSLLIDQAFNRVTAAGKNVAIYINGREANYDQLKAVDPSTVKRVEWIDNPGLRYGDAAYVVNVVIVNPTQGGSFMSTVRQGLNMAFGFYGADVKVNRGASQFEIMCNGKLTDKLKVYRQYDETFTYPDGQSLNRREIPNGGNVSDSWVYPSANYSYIKPDTTVFYAGFQMYDMLAQSLRYYGTMKLSNGNDDILLDDGQDQCGITPSLTLYLEQHFSRKQTLVVNFNGEYYAGHTSSDYVETNAVTSAPITDVSTYIRDRNQAYTLEADYIKRWTGSKFTAGAKYTANRNRSVYVNLDNEVFHQRQDKVYMFGEYFRGLGRVTVTAGLGAQYTSYLFEESDRGSSSWNLRPQLTVTYKPTGTSSLRMRFNSWQTAPTLAQTNVVAQQIDGFQWSVGNPDLRTYTSYMLSLRYNFSLPRVDASLSIAGYNYNKMIAKYYYWEGDRLYNSYENSKGKDEVDVIFAPQISVIPDWLNIGGTVQYTFERSRGTGYTYYNRNWSGDVNVSVTHWGFTLTGMYNRAQKSLNGQEVRWSESISMLDLSRNVGDWQLSAGMIMPFGRYDQGYYQLNEWNNNRMHMRGNLRMPYIKVIYNVQWGRQKASANRLIDSESGIERSAVKSR